LRVSERTFGARKARSLDLLVALVLRRIARAQLQAVERACASLCQRLPAIASRASLLPARIGRPHDRCKKRIGSKLVVVDHVLVPERDAEDALRQKELEWEFVCVLRAMVREIGGEFTNDATLPIKLAQQQGASIRGDRPSVARRHNRSRAKVLKREAGLLTLYLP